MGVPGAATRAEGRLKEVGDGWFDSGMLIWLMV
jgi:hypothetical protein